VQKGEAAARVRREAQQEARRRVPLLRVDDVAQRALAHQLGDDLHGAVAVRERLGDDAHDHDDVGVVQLRQQRHLAHEAVDGARRGRGAPEAHHLHRDLAAEVLAAEDLAEAAAAEQLVAVDADDVGVELPALARRGDDGGCVPSSSPQGESEDAN